MITELWSLRKTKVAKSFFAGVVNALCILFVALMMSLILYIDPSSGKGAFLPVLSVAGVVLLSLLVFFGISRETLSKAREEASLCPTCGYDWNHNEPGPCPECGQFKESLF